MNPSRHLCNKANRSHHSGSKTLDLPASSDYLAIKRQATWGMSENRLSMEVLVILGLIAAFVYFSSQKKEKKSSPNPQIQRPFEPPQKQTVSTSARSQAVGSRQKSTTQVVGLKTPSIQKKKFEQFEFCALDTETTGIVPKSARHRAFEISAVKFTPLEGGTWSRKRFTRYLKVNTSDMKGLKLSPMWNDHFSGNGQSNAVDSRAALNDLRSFVGNLPLICHNAKFDKCVIENEIEKTLTDWMLSNRWICTLEMARAGGFGEFVGYSPGHDDGKFYRLMDVAKTLKLNVEAEKLHHGYYDAELAGTILLKLHHMKDQPLKYVR